MTNTFCATAAVGFFLAVPLAAQYGRTGRAVEASFKNGHYRHANIAFDVPESWKYEGTGTGEGATDETAHWTDPQSGISLWVYRNPQTQKRAPEDIRKLVSDTVARKTRQRESQGYLEWHIRTDSVEPRTIGGHQGLSAIADFEVGPRHRNDSPLKPVQRKHRVECLTWIYAPNTTVLFFAFLGPDQIEQFRPVFDKVVRSVSLQ